MKLVSFKIKCCYICPPHEVILVELCDLQKTYSNCSWSWIKQYIWVKQIAFVYLYSMLMLFILLPPPPYMLNMSDHAWDACFMEYILIFQYSYRCFIWLQQEPEATLISDWSSHYSMTKLHYVTFWLTFDNLQQNLVKTKEAIDHAVTQNTCGDCTMSFRIIAKR